MNGSPYSRPRNQADPYAQTRPLSNPYSESRSLGNPYVRDRPQADPYARNQGHNNPNFSRDNERPFNYWACSFGIRDKTVFTAAISFPMLEIAYLVKSHQSDIKGCLAP